MNGCGGVLMVGTHRRTMGGIRAVVDGYEQAGLFARFHVTYVATHREGSAWLKAITALGGWCAVAVQLARLERPLVHVHLASRASFWRKSVVCLLARLAGRPYLLHLHGGGFRSFYFDECGRLARRAVRTVFARARLVLVLSDEWREVVGDICPSARIEVLTNGVPLPSDEALRAHARQPGRILFLGQIAEAKGIFDLIHAFARIAPRFPDARLVCAGPGEIESARALAARLGVAGRVELPGWIDAERKRCELGAASVFALPSHAEGMPMALLEAMAWGLPAVSTPVGSIPRLLQRGEAGLLVAPRAVDELAAALAALLGDPARGAYMGRAARAAIASRASLEASVEQLGALYRRLGVRESPPLRTRWDIQPERGRT